MTTILRTPLLPVRAPMTSTRRAALIAGVFYLITFVTSIPTLVLYGPAKKLDFVVGTGGVSGAQWGAYLEVLCALSGIGTAVALYPIVKRQSQAGAVGFVAARVLEASMIVVGVASLLTLVTLRQDLSGATGADRSALITVGKTLVVFHDWTFVLGQSLMPSISAVLLGSMLYRSRLVPRAIPMIGLIGAPILFLSVAMTIFGVWGQLSPIGTLAGFPIGLWELSAGLWMTFKGFSPSAIAEPRG
jgi:hypothetical protein